MGTAKLPMLDRWDYTRDEAFLRKRVLPMASAVLTYFDTRFKKDAQGRIVIDPARRSGKPCVRGTRITVYDVLDYLASGMSEGDILSDFPELQSDDIRASLMFAAERERRLVGIP